jgi:hypothetical protein
MEKTFKVRLRFMFHYCISPQQTANQPRAFLPAL